MANVTLKTKLIHRNDTEANWQKVNPVLLKGEVGYCTDKQYLKFGDGTTTLANLPIFNKNSVVLRGTQPDEDTDTNYDIGTLWINALSEPTEIFIRVRHNELGDSWVNLLTYGSLIKLEIMQEKDFAKTQGSGAETGYVDKALVADKLKTARTIALTGSVSGSTSFDGSGNASITTSLTIAEKDIPTLQLSKIKDAGSVASRNVGTEPGQVPVLNSSGKLDAAILPQLASVLSVNGMVGVVTLTTDDITEGSHLYFTNDRVASFMQDVNNSFIMDGGNA